MSEWKTPEWAGTQADRIAALEAQLAEARTGWERECQDGDRLCEALGISRTEGGSLQVAKMVNAIENLREGPSQRDQARYVWLRDKSPASWTLQVGDLPLFKGDLDAAIDAARSQP